MREDESCCALGILFRTSADFDHAPSPSADLRIPRQFRGVVVVLVVANEDATMLSRPSQDLDIICQIFLDSARVFSAEAE